MPELFQDTLHSSLIPTKVASGISGYNADYLARLCREKKIEGTQVGRSWLINRSSLEAFVTEQEDRKKHRSEELRAQRGKEYRRAQKPVLKSALSKTADMRALVASSLADSVAQGVAASRARARAFARHTYHAVRSHTRVPQQSYSPRLAALAVALVVVTGSAYASTDVRFLTAFTAAPDAAVRIAMRITPSLERSSSFRITEADAPADLAQSVPNVPAAQDASRAVALLIPSAGVAAFDSVRTLTDDARTPFTDTSVASVAAARIAAVSDMAHDPFGTFVRAYMITGESLYAVGANVEDAYLSAITATGDRALARAATLRDGIASLPRVTNALLDGYANGVYAWDDAATRAPNAAVLALYSFGDSLSSYTAMAPAIARSEQERIIAAAGKTAHSGALALAGTPSSAGTRPADGVTQAPSGVAEAATQPPASASTITRPLASLFAKATQAHDVILSLPVRAENTMLGFAGYASSIIDGTETVALVASSTSAAPQVALAQESSTAGYDSAATGKTAPDAPSASTADASASASVAALASSAASPSPAVPVVPAALPASAISFLPVSWQQSLAGIFHSSGTLAGGFITSAVRSLTNLVPGGTVMTPTLTVLDIGPTDTLALPAPANVTNTASSGGAYTDNRTVLQTIVNNYFPSALMGGAFNDAVLAIVRPFVNDSISASLKNNRNNGGGGGGSTSGGTNTGVSSDGATLTNVTISSGTATLSSLTVTGPTNLATTTVNGDLTVTGTLTVGNFVVSNLSSNNAVIAPYFTATSTTATSTFPNLTTTNADITALRTTQFTLGSSLFTSLLGTGLANIGGVLTVSTSSFSGSGSNFNADLLDGLDSSYLLANSFSTSSADAWFMSKTTDALPEGTTNLYFTSARARAALSVTGTGLAYNSTTGAFSVASGYEIPLTASTTEWNSAYQNRITVANAPLSITNNILSISQANGSTNGYLSSIDWNTFNNKQSALTFTYPLLNTSNTISLAFGTSTSNTWGGTQTFTNPPVLGSLTGFLKASAGVLSTSLIDLSTDVSSTLPVSHGGTGSTSLAGLLKGNGAGAILSAVSGVDYAPATTGGSIVYGNGAGGFSNATIGSGLSFAAGTLAVSTTSFSGSGSNFNADLLDGLDSTYFLANGFATTSADYWKTQRNFYSTTSADFWLTGKSTTDLAEGNNLYYTSARATSSFVANLAATTSVNSITALSNLGTVRTTLTGILKATSGVLSTAIAGTDYESPLTFTYPLVRSTNTISLAFGTTTANSWSQLQQFNGGASTTQLTTTGSSYLATSGGNVGIGTTIPTARLHVVGSTAATADEVLRVQGGFGSSGDGGGIVLVGGSGTGNGGGFSVSGGTGVSGVGGSVSLNAGGTVSGSGGGVYITSGGGTAAGIISLSAGANSLNNGTPGGNITLNPGNGFTSGFVPVFGNVIQQNGFFGLGTTSPYAKLSVNGDIALTGGIYDNSATRGTNGQVLQTTGTGVQWVSTSTLGFAAAGSGVTSFNSRVGAVVPTSADYTTTLVNEGTNLYYTSARGTANFISNLAATTSVSSITTLANLSLPLSQTTGILAQANGGTSFGSYTAGDILYADNSGNLAKLPIGGSGTVLKVQGGLPSWGVDQTVGGGGSDGIFATSSGKIYPLDTSNVVIIGTNATSSPNSIFEVNGLSYFSNKIGIGTTSPTQLLSVQGNGLLSGTLTAADFIDTNATANTLAYFDSTKKLATTTIASPLTFSAGTLGIQVANGSQNGYLSSADFNTFNGKQAALTFTYPLVNTANTISLSFGTTTSNTWAGTQTFTNAPVLGSLTGILYGNSGTLATAATSTPTLGLGLTYSGTLGSFIGGSAGSLAISTTSFSGSGSNFNADLLDGLDSTYFLANGFATTSADYWKTQRNFYSTTSADFWLTGKTTTDLAEGSNLYWTNTRFDNRLSATTTLPNITTLANLATVKTSLTGILKATSGVLSTAIAGTDYESPLTFTYPLVRSTNTISLAFGTTTSNTWAGTQTFTNAPVLGTLTGVLYGNSGTLATSATSTPTLGLGLTYSGTLGSFIGGSSGSLAISTTSFSGSGSNFNADFLDGFDSAYFLANGFATTSADYYKTQRNFYSTTSADYWLTTKNTDNLAEGSTNLYWTNTRFDNRLSATTTLPNLTTLANLGTIKTSLTGILKATSGVLSNAVAGTDYENPLTFTYPLVRSTNTISLAFGTTTSNTWAGTQTFTNAPVLGTLTGLIYGNSGTLATAATSTPTLGLGITYSGTLGSFVGGSAGAFAISTTSFSGSGSNFNADLLDGFDSSYFISGAFATTSADYWKTQRNFYSTTSADYWLTTKNTDNLTEGSTNLYWTNTRFDNRLSATTTLPNITTLANLATVKTSLTGILKATSGVLSTAVAGTDYQVPLTFTYPLVNTANTISLAFGTTTANTWSALQTFGGGINVTGNTTLANATSTNEFSGRLTANTFAAGQTGSTTISSTGALSTPSLTIGSLTGILKATSGVVSTAVAGTDYAATTTGNSLLYGNGSGGFLNANISSPITFSGGFLGIQKADNTQPGYLSSADWSTFNGKQDALTFTYPLVNTTNTISLAFGTTSSNTWGGTQTFTNSPVFSSLAGGLVSSNASTKILYNTATSTPTLGTGLSYSGTLGSFAGGVSGTLSVSTSTFSGSGSNFNADLLDGFDSTYFVANGYSTTSANYWLTTKTTTDLAEGSNLYWTNTRFDNRLSATTTLPNITTLANLGTVKTSLTGILKATAGVLSVAVSGTDFAATTTGSSILSGNGAGGFTNVNISSPITFSGGFLGIQKADNTQPGYLSSTDWSTFNGKQDALTFTYPLVNTANTISLAFGTTTANTWSALQTFGGGINVTGNTTLANATSTNLFSGRLTANTAAFGQTGSTTISSTGALSTPSLTIGSLSGVLYGNAGAVAAVATSTPTVSGAFSYSGTLGSFVGGASGALSLATNGVALTNIAQIAANTILGNPTGATGNVQAFATSSLGIALSDTTGTLGVTRGGTGLASTPSYGQILVGNGSGYTLTATSSLGLGTVTSVNASGGTTGLSFSGGPVTNSGTLTLAGTLGVANGGTGSTTLSGLLKGNGTGALLTAVAGTDYQAPLTFTYPLINSSNTVSLAFGTTTANTWSALQTFNGGITTSALTLGSVSGVLYGNSGVVSAAATSTPTLGLGLSYSGTLGSFVGGSSGALTIATSSLYTGTTGQVAYFNGTNSLIGTSSINISTIGLVGVGSTTPGSTFSIGTAATNQNAANVLTVNGGRFGVNGQGINLNAGNASGAGGQNGGNISLIAGNGNAANGGSVSITAGSAPGAIAGDVNISAGLSFDGTYRYISLASSGGNVGIGTTSPYARLSVVGQTVSEYFTATSTSATSTLPNLLATNIRIPGLFYDGANSAGTNGMVLQTTGTGVQWVATSSLGISGGGGSGTVNSGTTGQFPYYAANGTTLTATSSIFLAASGNVGIGSTSPSAKLSVDGDIFANNIIPNGTYTNNLSAYSLGNSGARWNSVWAGTLNIGTSTFSIAPDSSSNLGFFTAASGGGTQALTITQDGYVAVGVQTSPIAKLMVVGPSNLSGDAIDTLRVQGGSGIGGNGSSIYFNTGTGSINGGGFNVNAGTGISGTGGQVAINAGGTSSGAGGDVSLTAGSGVTTSGAVYLSGGFNNANNGTAGGNVYLSPGFGFTAGFATVYGNVVQQNGNFGLGTSSPYAKLSVNGRGVFNQDIRADFFTATSTTASSTLPNLLSTNLSLSGKFYDGSNSAGTNGYVLQTTGTGVQWVATSSLGISGGGSGITSIGPAGQLQTGSTQTLATSTSSYNGLTVGLTITASGNTQTFQPTLSGSLTTVNTALTGLLKATSGVLSAATPGTDYQVPLTFTYPLVNTANTISLAFGTTTANTWSSLQTFNGGITTSGTVTLGSLSGVLYGNSGVVASAATSTPTLGLGLSYSGTLGSFVGGSTGSLTIATSSLFTGSIGQVPYFSGTNAVVGTSTITIGTNSFVGIGSTTPPQLLSIGGNVIIGASAAGGTNGTLTYGGVTLANTVTGTGSLVLATAPTFVTSIAAPTVTISGTTGTDITATALTSGTGLLATTGITSGTGINFAGTALTSGTAVNVNTTGAAITTASAIKVTGTSATLTADYTGAWINLTPTRLLTSATTRTESGNMIAAAPVYSITGSLASILNVTGTSTNITRAGTNTSSSGSSQINYSGPLLSLASSLSCTTGVCTDTSNLLSISQTFSTASGAVVKVVNAGTGPLATFSGTGNFGVGTTSPYKLLSIGGDVVLGASAAGGTPGDLFLPKLGVAAGTFLAVDATGKVIATTTPTTSLTGTIGQIAYFSGTNTAVGTSSITIGSTNSFVGIGSTTPGAQLAVGGDLFANNIIPNGTYTNNLSAYSLGNSGARWNQVWTGTLNVGTSTFSLSSNNASSLGFYTAASAGGTQALTIMQSGNVGIGTSTPYAQLAIGGGNLVLGAASAGGTPGDLLLPKLGTSAGSFLAVDATGKVISTTTPSGGGGSGTVNSGTIGQLPYYAANGTALTATSSIFLAATGNVGIGTTTPNYNLAVAGSFGLAGSFYDKNYSAGTSGMVLQTSGTGVQWVATSTLGLSGGGGGSGTVNSGVAGYFGYYPSTGTTIDDQTVLFTDGTNIGIGSSTPSAKLSITGAANTKALSVFGGSSYIASGGGSTSLHGSAGIGGGIELYGGNGGGTSDGTAGNGGDIYIAPGAGGSASGGGTAGTAGNVILGVKLSGGVFGNVGIGTALPTAALTVLGKDSPGNADLALSVVGGAATGFSGDGGGITLAGGEGSSFGTGGNLIFAGGGTLGTSGVGGSISILAGAGETQGGDVTIRAGENDGFVYGYFPGNIILTPGDDSQGSYGFVRITSLGAGTVQSDSSGNLTVSSDERLKDISAGFTRGLADIEKLSPILYHWNAASGLNQADTNAGFSAQNVQSAIPEAVGTDSRGYLTLQDRPILAASVNAIKELAGRTDTLSLATTSLNTQFLNLSKAFASSTAQSQMPHALSATNVTANSIVIAQGVSAGSLTAQSANVDGTVSAARYVVPQVASVFSFGSSTISMRVPTEAFAGSGTVDLYKLAGYASAGVDELAARTDLLAVRLDDITTRLSALEALHAATSTDPTADAQGALGLAMTTVQDALKGLGIIVQKGYLALDSLVTHQLFLVKGTDGTSSTGSQIIPAGATTLNVTNPLVHPTSKIFLTFTSSVDGSWYLSKKQEGSFTITLAKPQPADTEFDYFLLQTDANAQVAAVGDTQPPAGTPEAPTAPAPVSQDGGPVVVLNGSPAMQLPQGAVWTDPGAHATAADGTDLTGSVTVSGSVDANTAGLYTVTYSVTDAAGKPGQASRVVTILSPTTGPSNGGAVTDSGSGSTGGAATGGTAAAGDVGTTAAGDPGSGGTVSAAPDASPAS